MLRYFPLVLKNAWRNRRRTVLTILSIAASLSLLGILMAIYAAFYFSAPPPAQALRLVVRNKVSLVFPMPEAYREKIKRIPGVQEVTAQQWFGGMYKIKAGLGDRITLQGDIFPITLELTVRAIFDSEQNSEVLYFNRKYLDESI